MPASHMLIPMHIRSHAHIHPPTHTHDAYILIPLHPHPSSSFSLYHRLHSITDIWDSGHHSTYIQPRLETASVPKVTGTGGENTGPNPLFCLAIAQQAPLSSDCKCQAIPKLHSADSVLGPFEWASKIRRRSLYYTQHAPTTPASCVGGDAPEAVDADNPWYGHRLARDVAAASASPDVVCK
ncbi:hypothetical protein BDV98DRAFT_297700 [Pterulicium gracile]|uniref:Uncharacterized protein n=1 Tax=Pterulicium gracile TaxID=1884261 RepID=A0A5C3Q4M3_9AGAR|nr:hypothetical protein BDV98DRAFT_297700 [Pterula gracilis]